MRSALAALAVSIADHSSFEWQVRVGNMDPVVSSLRQMGLGGFVLACNAVAPVALEGTFVCAWVVPDPMINAAAIQNFIVTIRDYFRQMLLNLSSCARHVITSGVWCLSSRGGHVAFPQKRTGRFRPIADIQSVFAAAQDPFVHLSHAPSRGLTGIDEHHVQLCQGGEGDEACVGVSQICSENWVTTVNGICDSLAAVRPRPRCIVRKSAGPSRQTMPW